LIIGLIPLIDISTAVGIDIVGSRPCVIGTRSCGSRATALPTRTGPIGSDLAGTGASIEVRRSVKAAAIHRPHIPGDYPVSAAVDIRPVVVDIDIPVPVKIISIIPVGPGTIPYIRRTIYMRSPPATTAPAMAAPVTTTPEADAEMEPSRTKAITKTPSCPGIITHIETPGPGTRIIIAAIPGIIVETGSIDHGRTIDICVQVAGSITHIYILRGYIIYINILDIV
jgi:hypothetical protein